MEKTILENDFVYIRIDEDGVFCRDKTDVCNEESMYTKSKRWLKKCIEIIKEHFDKNTEFQTIINYIDNYNIKYRRYCWMD